MPKPNTRKILVVDDDKELNRTISIALETNHFNISRAEDGLSAIELVKREPFDLVLLDVGLPKLNGLETLKKIKEYDPSIIVIIMTAFSNVEDAVLAIKEGAYNYLPKPIKHQAIVEMVERAIQANEMIHDMAFSAPVIHADQKHFIGGSSEIRKLYEIILKLSKVDTSVLIRGESGTGKELVAKAIHLNSIRKDQKLVALNCSAIPETLFESELFGHEKGAFTGADQRKIGKFQYAEGGTLFFDEIGDLSPAMQIKLLRVLQERKFTPIGSHREIEMNVRIISATNRNLEELIEQGSFREDLFYRLNVIPIYLPPLRERKDDIEKLVSHFIARFNQVHHKNISGINHDALNQLIKHEWRGNIRELENVIEHCFVIETGEHLTVHSLPKQLIPGTENLIHKRNSESTPILISSQGELDYSSHKEQFEREFIISALKQNRGKINQTALKAKIPKKTLLRKLQKYNIHPEDFRD